MRKPHVQTIFLGTAVLAVLVLAGYMAVVELRGPVRGPSAHASGFALDDIPFDGRRAYSMLEKICDIGRRPSGSPGMEKQQKLLADHFTKLGGRVHFQEFTAPHPTNGSKVPMANIVVQWHPDRTERILLCTHYDTLPYPLRDPNPLRRDGIFIGANDGGSGTALLTELAYHMPRLDSRYGVDFVLVDGEEFVFENRRGKFFLGSEHFAREYVRNPPPYRYRFGVVLDMVGDADLQIYQERNSMRWPETRPLVLDIWQTAKRLGVKEFIARPRHTVDDDHVPLNNIAKIPTCDLIDFDYPRPGYYRSYWHTEADVPKHCSALSLAKVGWVVLEWLKNVE